MRSDTLHLIPLSAPWPRCLPGSEGEQQIFPPQRRGQSHSRLAQTPLIALTEQGAAKDPVKGTLGRSDSKRLKRAGLILLAVRLSVMARLRPGQPGNEAENVLDFGSAHVDGGRSESLKAFPIKNL
ncbi:hypothetical protein DPX16_10590 [Anabarilius grahami]|uniref:Uncharacterized protein n=1 Tax=Anabarilius grahami TaxID=495550 RepID=A0A3N0Z6S7_ANAGA|nr:hypothetical protein DPX16_10590 [Anabarilius grahami]